MNFSLKLVDAINEEKFDSEMLKREAIRQPQSIDTSEIDDYKKFEQLVTTISLSSEDQNDFMSQYEKVLSTKPRR